MSSHPIRAALMRTYIASDGYMSTSIENARVKCAECDGWTGTACPHGCGVHLASTQADDDKDFMERLRVEQAAQKKARAERTARKEAR